MTPAVRYLQQLKSRPDFEVLSYEHQPGNRHYGAEAVAALGLEAAQVFKTLIVSLGSAKDFAVCLVPVEQQLKLKSAAHALGCKKLEMAAASDAERITGYQLGGVSPLGQRKRLPTLIDTSARQFEQIYISAGRRGLELKLSPEVLQQLLQARFAQLTA